MIKGVGPRASSNFCGSRDAIFYHAEAGSLPATFADGQWQHGAYNSIQVQVITPGEQVRFANYQSTSSIIYSLCSHKLPKVVCICVSTKCRVIKNSLLSIILLSVFSG